MLYTSRIRLFVCMYVHSGFSRLDLPAAGPSGRPLVRQRDLLQLDPDSWVVRRPPTIVSSLCVRYECSPQCVQGTAGTVSGSFLSYLLFWLSGLAHLLGAFRDFFLFFNADSACQIRSTAAVRDQKAPQTDAQCHPLVDILRQRDHYMWWVTETSVRSFNNLLPCCCCCFISQHSQKKKKKTCLPDKWSLMFVNVFLNTVVCTLMAAFQERRSCLFAHWLGTWLLIPDCLLLQSRISLNSRILVTQTKNTHCLFGGWGGAISCHVLMPFRNIRHPVEPEILFQFLLRCVFTFDTGDLHGRLDDLLLIFYKVKLRIFL